MKVPWLPGWSSVAATDWWSTLYFWVSMVSLALLLITETLSHIYGERHKTLVDQGHQAQVTTLQREIQAQAAPTITPEQHTELVRLLTPIPIKKTLVLFNPLATDGRALAFSEQIKSVLRDAGFPVADVPFGDRLLSFSRLGVFIQIKEGNEQPAQARYIYEAFKRVGIDMKGLAEPGFDDPDKVVIVVGAQP
jgi:hypothetical protein